MALRSFALWKCNWDQVFLTFKDFYMDGSRKYWVLGTVGVILFSLVPILFPPFDSWDFAVTEMGFLRQDYSYFDVFKRCHQVRYFILVALSKFPLLGISPKVVMNVLSVLCVVGLSHQVFLFLHRRYKFSWEASLIGAWGILAFPVWHTLISGALFSYILFLFLFMTAVNQWWSKHYVRAGILLLASLSYYSLFAFAVGFAVSEFVLTVDRDNYKKKMVQTFLFSAVLLTGYILLETFVNIREYEGYNEVNLKGVTAFVLYGIASVLALTAGTYVQKKMPAGELKDNFIRYELSFLILGLFAVLAYWAVGHPMRYFSFGSYGSRHTYLTCIPFALLLAIGSDVSRKFWSQKAVNIAVGALVVVLVVILHQGYSHKAAALIYRDVIAQEIAKQEEPGSGYVVVSLVGKQAPRHLHAYELARALYRAFGKTAWMLNDPWRRSHNPTPENMKKLYATMDDEKGYLYDQVSGDAYTRYDLHLEEYHQEGRFWYWWYFITNDYSAFNPKLVLVQEIPSLSAHGDTVF